MTAESQNGNRAPAKNMSTAQAAKAPVNYPGKKYVDASIQFLREVRVELRKVTWPSRKQTIGSTVVVIVLVLIISAFLGVVDVLLQSLINLVI
jgi:preprotein translocase subunit SecE